jgi:hypothetical protein
MNLGFAQIHANSPTCHHTQCGQLANPQTNRTPIGIADMRGHR